MQIIKGNIYNYKTEEFVRGVLYFDDKIRRIEENDTVQSDKYIIPGFVDAHVHIESSMLTPVEFAKEALQFGVIGAVTDPHEIANVSGIEGVKFMKRESEKTSMKILVGAPSCVPATFFETSGGVIGVDEVEKLFSGGWVSHLSEMMNYPGVLSNESDVLKKIGIAKKYKAIIDGHAPMVRGDDLKKYVASGISTDHECSTLEEAVEKIELGMNILLRRSSASNDFLNLHSLVKTHTSSVMLCCDDCHADDLQDGYLKRSVDDLIRWGYSFDDIVKVVSVNPVKHYGMSMGLLQKDDYADFLVVDNLEKLNIEQVFVDGKLQKKGENEFSSIKLNRFYKNEITIDDLKIQRYGDKMNVIEVMENSLFTRNLIMDIHARSSCLEPIVDEDILKVVVLNRYKKAKPIVGFIKGIGLKRGAIATTIAHDSHNIIACGVDDGNILSVINDLQQLEGGMVVKNGEIVKYLQLEVGGLMTNRSCSVVASLYKDLLREVREMGSKLYSPFMTLSFMSLLVIPEIKIGDKGLFDVKKFEFINLQY